MSRKLHDLIKQLDNNWLSIPAILKARFPNLASAETIPRLQNECLFIFNNQLLHRYFAFRYFVSASLSARLPIFPAPIVTRTSSFLTVFFKSL